MSELVVDRANIRWPFIGNKRFLRDDLALAAYAASLGFKVEAHDRGFSDANGIPADALTFRMGWFTVWFTSKGWRAAGRNCAGLYPKPKPSDFYQDLKAALDYVAGIHQGYAS